MKFEEIKGKHIGLPGYTGGTRDRILLVYEVHVGNPFVYEG